MTKVRPYFSIIVPCYNQGHFLTKAIESVRSQSFKDWELIIVNDGSNDNTQTLGENFSAIDSRIQIFSQTNLGLSMARNAGLRIAKGQVINFLDADDWFLDNCLSEVSIAFKRSSSDIIITGYEYHLERHILHVHNFNSIELKNSQFRFGNLAPPVAFFTKQIVINSIGDFDPFLKSCEDWDYWIRASKSRFKFFGAAKALVAYRYVKGSMSKQPRQMYEALNVVSRKAITIDNVQISKGLFNVHLSEIVKQNFLKCLGVNLYQGKVEESILWYIEESQIWNWVLTVDDWKNLSSNLSFKYFNSLELINPLFKETAPNIGRFLSSIGYSEKEVKKIIRGVFLPQLRILNHIKYGKIIGMALNKIRF